MKKTILLQLFLGWTAIAAAQSTICHEDGTVTFQYKNDQAKEVMVDVQFAGRDAMKRDAQGLWTVTLGPAAPDMYPYCFIVDGVSVMDPENPQYFPNEGFKNSLLEIPAREGSLAHDIKNVPHGSLEYIHYYSKSLGATNQAVVYLPPKYKENPEKKYPVFYCISGTTDTEEVYYKVGRVNYILDNLLAEGKAEEMIVVLPYGNPYKLLPTPQTGMFGAPGTQFGNDVFSLDLNNDLMPYVESHYRTINDAAHRAIGGFSRGGNQALFNGLSHLDKFSYLCSYSSFTSTDIPQVYDNAADTNSKIRLFWLGVGTDDFLYGNARDYTEFLDKHGITSVKEYTHNKFGHTWMNAKYFLSKTLPLLFNPKAAEEAMKNAQPTRPATGKEQQFTPGVMARLFPKPIISPEYKYDSVIFRMKAPEAKEVLLAAEILPKPIAMERDSDGIWSIEVDEHIYETFTYYFIVDGTSVADPQNMYLAPSKGFKPSVCSNPAAVFHYSTMAEMEHGVVSYDLNAGKACYHPAEGKPQFVIQLIPGKDDTIESWFKIGGADVMADKFIAAKKLPPFCITTGCPKCMKHEGKCEKQVYTIKADDYANWPERRHALESLLDSLMLQRAAKGEISLNLPLFQTKYTADPSPLVVGDRLFLFTSHDASPEDIPDLNEKSSAGFFMYDWLLWSTTDMVNWTEHGAVASLKDIPWRSRENGAWAIQTVERNGKYYLYAPLHGHGIAVLEADSPYGPFKDPLGKPLVWDQSNWYDIDPSVFTDDDGQAYLYWGNPHTFYAKLNDDMVSLKGEVTKLPHIKHYQEGPWFYKRNGHYYVAYASTCCPEALGYAMSDAPTGPWEWKNYIMRPTLRDRGNHPGICDFKGHSYVFGQNYDLMHLDTFTHHERRSVSATEINYNDDGTIQEVPYWLDQEPMKQLCWLNPYERVEAETMAWGYGLKSAKMGIENTGVVADMPTSTGKKNMYIFDINDGEFIKLRGVDFAQGARKFSITAASTGSCKVTLRIDSQEGPVIGEAQISKTGNAEKYKVFSTDVSNASGVHDLYLCFGNTSGDTRLDWWQFKK